MQKKIIILYGSPNAGKTCTLIKVCAKLQRLNKYPPEIIDKCAPIRADKNEGKIKDIYLIVRINGIDVGIVTHGDDESVIEQYLKPFRDKGCTIIICAARTYKAAIRVSQKATNYKLIPPLRKVKVRDQSNSENAKASDAKAEEIVAMVEENVDLCHETQ